jgi:transposase-like protein
MRRSKPEMKKLVAQYRKSGLSIIAFCQKHDIVRTTFDYWLRKDKEKPTGGFVAIKPPSMPLASIELRFPNGIILNTTTTNFDFISSLIRLA